MLYAPLTPEQKKWYDAALSRDIRSFLIQKKCGVDPTKDTEEQTSDGPDGAPVNDESEVDVTLENLDAMINAEEEHKEKKTDDSSRRTRGVVRSYTEKSDTEYFKDLESGKDMQKHSDSKVLTAREVDFKKASKSVTNMKLMNVVMQLRKVCNHPFLFDWPIDPKTHMPVLSEDLLNASGKMLLLNRLLDALFTRGHKVLIFSQFTTMLDIIQDWAEIYKKWTCCRIDGSVSQDSRRQQISDFNKNPELKLFLLSTRAGGLGINLTSADTVIIFDSDWVRSDIRESRITAVPFAECFLHIIL